MAKSPITSHKHHEVTESEQYTLAMKELESEYLVFQSGLNIKYAEAEKNFGVMLDELKKPFFYKVDGHKAFSMDHSVLQHKAAELKAANKALDELIGATQKYADDLGFSEKDKIKLVETQLSILHQDKDHSASHIHSLVTHVKDTLHAVEHYKKKFDTVMAKDGRVASEEWGIATSSKGSLVNGLMNPEINLLNGKVNHAVKKATSKDGINHMVEFSNEEFLADRMAKMQDGMNTGFRDVQEQNAVLHTMVHQGFDRTGKKIEAGTAQATEETRNTGQKVIQKVTDEASVTNANISTLTAQVAGVGKQVAANTEATQENAAATLLNTTTTAAAAEATRNNTLAVSGMKETVTANTTAIGALSSEVQTGFKTEAVQLGKLATAEQLKGLGNTITSESDRVIGQTKANIAAGTAYLSNRADQDTVDIRNDIANMSVQPAAPIQAGVISYVTTDGKPLVLVGTGKDAYLTDEKGTQLTANTVVLGTLTLIPGDDPSQMQFTVDNKGHPGKPTSTPAVASQPGTPAPGVK